MSSEITFTLLRKLGGLVQPAYGPSCIGVFTVPNQAKFCFINSDNDLGFTDLNFYEDFPEMHGARFKEVCSRLNNANVFSFLPAVYLDSEAIAKWKNKGCSSNGHGKSKEESQKEAFCSSLYEEVQSSYLTRNNFLYDALFQIFVAKASPNSIEAKADNECQAVLSKADIQDCLDGFCFYSDLIRKSETLEGFKKIWSEESKFVHSELFLDSSCIESLLPCSPFHGSSGKDDSPNFVSELKDSIQDKESKLACLDDLRGLFKHASDMMEEKSIVYEMIASLSY